MRHPPLLRASLALIVLAVVLQAKPAAASAWALIWQGVVHFARDVAVSFAADQAGKMLDRSEVAKLRRRIEELEKEVRGYRDTAPAAEVADALEKLRQTRAMVTRVAATFETPEAGPEPEAGSHDAAERAFDATFPRSREDDD